MAEKVCMSVFGLLNDVTFHMAKCCAEDLHAKNPTIYPQPEINGLLEFEWSLYIEDKKKEIRGEMWAFDEKAITFVNGVLIGGPKEFLQWAETKHCYENFRPLPLYVTLAEEAYKAYLNSKPHDYVFLDISIGDNPAGRLVIEVFLEFNTAEFVTIQNRNSEVKVLNQQNLFVKLYSDILPKTCANFLALCTGEKGESEKNEFLLHFKDSIIHRVLPNGWIQGGDIWMKRGNGGESIYGPTFEDENFAISNSRRGIVGMANQGPHSNGSQFYILLAPAKWMDTKYVAFGQIIEGTKTLHDIEQQETMNERPLVPVTISDCGACSFTF